MCKHKVAEWFIRNIYCAWNYWQPFGRFLDNFELFLIIEKSSRRHLEAIKKRLRYRQEAQFVAKKWQDMSNSPEIFEHIRALLGLPETTKNRQEVPRSAKKLFKRSPRTTKKYEDSQFGTLLVQKICESVTGLRPLSQIYEYEQEEAEFEILSLIA